MSELTKEDMIVKCHACNQDLIVGQKFCAECGAEQDVPIKTKEEIVEMRERILKLPPPKDLNTLMQSMILVLTANSILGWVLGFTSDQKLLDIIAMKRKTEGGDEK